MTDSYWPPTTHGFDAVPDVPDLLALEEALQPLRPFIGGIEYGQDGDECFAKVTFGGEAHQVLISVRGNHLTVDSPLGSVPQTAENMLRLLQLNISRSWPFRVDGSGPEATLQPDAAFTVVVIERRAHRDDLPDLARLVLEAWRERTLAQAMVYEMRGELDD